MSKQPQQLFDGSYFEAILRTPALKTPPPPISASPPILTNLPEFQTFDWDAYNREFFGRVPNADQMSDRGRAMAQIAGTQIWMAQQFPTPVLNYLLLHAPAKLLWQYLAAPERKTTLETATRGFQRTPAIVRQPVVRARLLQWLQKTPTEIYMMLVIWGMADPPIVEQVRQVPDGAAREFLPGWIAKFSMEATFAALAMAAKPRTMATLIGWLDNPDELARVVEQDRQKAEKAAAEESPAPASSEPEHPPDSEAAHFWKTRAEEAEKRDRTRSDMLNKMLDANERFTTVITAQKAEIETLQGREKKAGEQAEKKIAAAQTRFKTELDELKKSFERQGRKFRALEIVKDALETENRRLKKQLRQTGMLLEEERRRVAALEARLMPAAPVEEISTPQSKQSAPGKTVVVQAPTPLDEIFEWRADGRLVRITARAVRRLIDQNDEEALFSILQALDSLHKSDKSLHGKFHKRLGDAGAYYARVLSENMTRVLVDASNVARYAPNKYGKGQLRHLIGMRDELRRLNCFPIIFIADASLRYFIDDAARFREMVTVGEVQVVDKGVEADEILAREARRTGAYVVTNDAKFFHKVSPDFEPPRVTFRIYDGTVIVDEF